MATAILIVDDEQDIRQLIANILEDEGFQVYEAHDSKTTFQLLKDKDISLVLLDIWLDRNDLDGLQILQKIKKDRPEQPVIMISGHGNVETAVNATKYGAYDFIEKPFEPDRMIVTIKRALENIQLKEQIDSLKTRISNEKVEILGESKLVKKLRQDVARVAKSGSRVLISGAAGTGKGVTANNIHNLSDRNDQPFVSVNCAMMQSEDLESELFGSALEDGDKRKTGTFERANKGSLFLDEIGDMPLEAQGKIVRILQDEVFHRPGDSQPIELDVRIISSSSQNLEENTEKGLFRQDLYYRINVVPLYVPSLKERKSDIPVLIDSLLESFSGNLVYHPIEFEDQAMQYLIDYDWPGNVRQLRNILEWILIMTNDEDKTISVNMLPPEIKNQKIHSLTKSKEEINSLNLREARNAFEKSYLLNQISRFNGNISRTANFIGMERTALHRKLKALGLEEEVRKEERSEK